MFTRFFFFISLTLFTACGSSSSSKDTQNIKTSELYTTALFDDFNYNDQTIWQSADWANGTPFLNAWCPDQIDFNKSILTISLQQKDCHSRSYASGEYRTYNTYKYGRYSTRFQASEVNGTITSFFTYTGPAEGTEWDEIDIEIIAKDTTKVQFNYWRNAQEHPKVFDLGFDASKEMHTYSFIWHKDYIKYYVDEKLLYTVYENHLEDNNSLPVNAGKIMINMWAATGIDQWSGSYPLGTTSTAKYDWVKYESFEEQTSEL
jgi:beta-glucanase (GH16 family)